MKRIRRHGLGMVLAALLPGVAGLRAWETTDAQVDWISRPSLQLETSHIRWAKPYAQGPIRVLYCVGSDFQGMGTRGREVIETMQRFDLTVDLAYHYNFYRPHWFGGWVGERRLARLLAEKEYDLFVFQYISPDALPELGEARASFLRAVKGGAGVLLSGIDDGGILDGKQAVEPVPDALAGVPVQAVFRLGEGRIVALPEPPVIPYDVGWQVRYENWQEQIGRAMLWAAGKSPAMRVSLSAGAETIERETLPAETIRLSVSDRPATPVRGRVNLRHGDGETTVLFDGDLDGATETRLSLPRLKAGRYHLDAIISGGRGVETWTTASLAVTTTVAVALALEWDRRESVAEWARWNTPWGEVGDRMSGRIQADLAEGHTLQLRLLDHTGRILEARDDPRDADARFQFLIEPWMPQLVRVEAVIMDNGEDVVSDHAWMLVTKPQSDRFHFVLWGFPDQQTLAPVVGEQLRRMGVTAILSHRPPDLAAAAHELAWVSFTGGHVGLHGGAENWQDFDPEKVSYFELQTGRDRPHGVLTYSLGDEGPVSGAGVGPKPMAAYRDYLRTVYGDIEALNRSWNTTFETVDAVVLSAPDDSGEKTALEAGHTARWYDRQAFHRYNFVRHARDHRSAMRKTDPRARIGFEGSGNFVNSGDPDWICRELDMWVPYAGPIDEVIRSIARPDFIRSTWMGYHWTADGLLAEYWRPIVYGANSLWWWMWSTLDPWRGFQAPDLSGFPATEEMLEDTRIVRDGLGDLLMNSEMLDDGIAMLYSMPSTYAALLEPSRTYGGYEAVHISWYTIIHDMPMQFRYVTDAMMDRGEFDAARTRVLILPYALAISDATAAAIRRFVESGGTVVADIRPGIYDGRCKPRAAGVLDDLFGIEGPIDTAAARADLFVDGAIGEQTIELKWPRVRVDPALKTTTGKALGQAGETPVFIVKDVGPGRAILMNLSPTALGGRRVARGLTGEASAEELDPAVWRAFQAVFAAAGATPVVSLQQLRRKEPPFMGNVRIQRWRNGAMQLFCLFRETQCGNTAQGAAIGVVSLHGFEQSPFVYDLRHQLTVGETTTVFADVIPARASFFAVLPGPAPAVRAELDSTRIERGRRAILTVSLPAAGDALHAVRIAATDASGREVPGWGQVVMAGKTSREIVLPVAVNDPPGTWHITATDVITPRTAATATLVVE